MHYSIRGCVKIDTASYKYAKIISNSSALTSSQN